MTPESTKFICYYRVSTEEQGDSGLGLEAQREQVREYLGSNGWEIIDEFTEVESGASTDRPELRQALRDCELKDATLIVARMDRLTRSASLFHELKDSDVEIVFADMPGASDLSMSVLASVSEYEREQISKRTKAALASSDKQLGEKAEENWTQEGLAKGREKSAEVRSKRADEYARKMKPYLHEAEAEGHTTLRAKAEWLEENNFTRPQGGEWSAMAVSRLESRIEALNEG